MTVSAESDREADRATVQSWALVDGRLRHHQRTVDELRYDNPHPLELSASLLRLVLADVRQLIVFADLPADTDTYERVCAFERDVVAAALAGTPRKEAIDELRALTLATHRVLDDARRSFEGKLTERSLGAKAGRERILKRSVGLLVLALFGAGVAWTTLRQPAPLDEAVSELPAPELMLPAGLEFGTLAARKYLGYGWANDEEGYVWAIGERSRVRFGLGAVTPLRLTMTCAPFAFPDAPEQRISVTVNGTGIGDVTLGRDGEGSYELTVPATALRAGPNEIEFRYAYARTPMAVIRGSTDVRPLSVQWIGLGFTAL